MDQRIENEELFKVVKTFHEKEELPAVCAQHPHLLPKLRPYQEKAVQWMVYRETCPIIKDIDLHCVLDHESAANSSDASQGLHVDKIPTGGILSDEMGLGKTVEVLACILINPRLDIEIPQKTPKKRNTKKDGSDEDESDLELYQQSTRESAADRNEKRKQRANRRSKVKDSTVEQSVKIENVLESGPVCRNIKAEKNEEFESLETLDVKALEASLDTSMEGSFHENIVLKEEMTDELCGPIDSQDTGVRKLENGVVDAQNIQGAASDAVVKNNSVDETGCNIQITCPRKKKSKQASRKPPAKAVKRKATEKDSHPDMGVSPKKKQVSAIKSSAQEWYESKLLEVNRNPIRAYRKLLDEDTESSSNNDVQCICDGEIRTKSLIRCGCCSRLLHKKCIGASKWEGLKPIYCPQCWLKQEVCIPSRATLIVSPSSISGQWLNEVKKHISPKAKFKVLFYKGVKTDGFLQPYEYSDYDLILTTYDVLRRELDLSELHEGRSRRYERRYYSPTCPLMCVGFWRICLDEAQMVEGHASKAAEMVSRLVSVHRWAVTGTPIQKSLQDLYGLVLFLCVEPYCRMAFWKNILYDPYCDGDKNPMYTLLANILWRSCKADVLDQIQIPPQYEQLWWLNFSPIEEHFYLRTHQECSNDFLQKLSKHESLDVSLSSLRLVTVNSVLTPLLKLRQACSHPHAVRGNIITNQKSTLTMPELLESLIKKTTVEAQDALRKHIASLNGMAGLHIICNEFASAAEMYREVLRITEEYKDRVNVDTLQKIHTLYNLAEIIQAHQNVIPPTLRDDQLLENSKQLEETYLKKAQASVKSVMDSLSEFTEAVDKYKDEMTDDDGNWWSVLLRFVDRDEILSRVHDALVNHRKSIPDVSTTSIINKVSTISSMQLTCCQWLQSIEKDETEVRKSLKTILKADIETLVNNAVNCHLRISNLKSKVPKARCELCACENSLKNYERDLFDIKTKKQENIMVGDVFLLGQAKEGSWKRSEQETVLKTLLTFGRLKKANKDLLKSGSKFFTLMDALRREFKHLRLLWSRINERTQAQDELNMCKLRLRLRLPDEISPSTPHVNRRKKVASQLSSNIDTKMENLHIIEPHQVEVMAQQNKVEAAAALSELRKKSGTMVYLQNLRTTDGDSKSDMEVCPVCRCNFEKKWAVLSCGHCYCMVCIPELFKKRLVLCAVCRETTLINEVSFVNASQELECVDEAGSSSGLVRTFVRGSHSTKVEAIVRRLFYLRAADPFVKVLIFSTWDRVLDVLKEALDQNEVNNLRLKHGVHYETTLREFKDTERVEPVTALLLLLKLGSKGLNLTEATHVMLVEPLMNPAEELQAIGRVHRIGQTRPTFVHRFLIKETIEDRMFSAVQATGKEQWSGKQVTLRQLKDLFSTGPPKETETITPTFNLSDG